MPISKIFNIITSQYLNFNFKYCNITLASFIIILRENNNKKGKEKEISSTPNPKYIHIPPISNLKQSTFSIY